MSALGTSENGSFVYAYRGPSIGTSLSREGGGRELRSSFAYRQPRRQANNSLLLPAERGAIDGEQNKNMPAVTSLGLTVGPNP